MIQSCPIMKIVLKMTDVSVSDLSRTKVNMLLFPFANIKTNTVYFILYLISCNENGKTIMMASIIYTLYY